MADPRAVRDAVDAVVRETGRLDVLVNNAGVDVEHRVATVSYDEWQHAWARTLAVNLVGAANASYCAARHMIDQGGGRIVNVSSRGAFRGEPDFPAYAASKAGLNALGQSLAVALGPFGILVATVAPGYVDTEMARGELEGPRGDEIQAQSPLGRVATPEEVARAVLFLASEGAEFTTGAILDVNGASYLRT
jgi:NAD(P)-dependent dehydrogenase (short-subunit alcohol dehydrogenase family)